MNSDLDVKDLIRIMREFMESKALFVAHQLDIFDRLAEGGKMASQLAEEINASEKGVRILCNALSGLGILVKDGEAYFLPDNLRGFLLTDTENSFRNYMEFLHDFWYIWTDLERVIRGGKPIASVMELIGKDQNKLKTFIDAMHERAREASRLLLKVVDISSRRRMLDIGGGSGTYSLEWTKRYPELRATILDLPHVLEITKDYVKKYGMEERVSFISGDFHKLELEKINYDMVLLANVLQMYDEEANINLLRKVYDSLERSGMVIIHGYALDDKEYRPLESALFGLSILSSTPSGDVYKRSEKIRWLREAGFRNIKYFEIDAIPSTVIVALR
ncbi:MAG: methyltransferase [Thermodesulfobacteriota bacterium]